MRYIPIHERLSKATNHIYYIRKTFKGGSVENNQTILVLYKHLKARNPRFKTNNSNFERIASSDRTPTIGIVLTRGLAMFTERGCPSRITNPPESSSSHGGEYHEWLFHENHMKK